MKDDLIERLKAMRPVRWAAKDEQTIQDAIDALSPVLPDEVETSIKHLRLLAMQQCAGKDKDYTVLTEWRSADLIERLWLSLDTSQKHCIDRQKTLDLCANDLMSAGKRIEELEEGNRNLNITNRDQWMHNKRLDAALAEIENTAKHCVGRYYKRITETARKARAGE